METSEKKGWTLLTLKKTVAFIPYILDIVYLLGVIAIMLLAADMFKTSGAEIDALIEAGDLPACVKTYALSLFGMLTAAILFLIRIRRRR